MDFSVYMLYFNKKFKNYFVCVTQRTRGLDFTVTLGRRSTRISWFFSIFIKMFLELQKKCLVIEENWRNTGKTKNKNHSR